MTQEWYRKAEFRAAIIGAIVLAVAVSLVARVDKPAATQQQVLRPEFGARLVSDSHFAALHFTIWNNTDDLIIAENLVLNWEFHRCERVVTEEVPHAESRSPMLPGSMVLEYTTKVVLPSSNGAAHLTFIDASDTVLGSVFKYAKGDVDYFWIVVKTPKFPDPVVGQTYDLWASFDYRHPSESESNQFRTDRIRRGTCTRVIAK